MQCYKKINKDKLKNDKERESRVFSVRKKRDLKITPKDLDTFYIHGQ